MGKLRELKLNNKVRLLNLINKDLREESSAIYEDLKTTRNDIAKVQEEMETEIFNIISTLKLLKDSNKENKFELLSKYIDDQYDILKKDLFEDDQSNEQII
ncbi:MAG: hypothetical protein IKE01_06450 [Clostridia bacterium]|nr:hypothetical protein [Clostridia bacterium]